MLTEHTPTPCADAALTPPTADDHVVLGPSSPHLRLNPPPNSAISALRAHLRGSSLLFVGRLMSKWLNFAVQVLVVRVLSQSDYGALAYVLSIVALMQQMATFGMDGTVARFLPIYQEHRRYDKACGTILLSLASVALLGVTLVVVACLTQNVLEQHVIRDRHVLILLVVLAFLVPLQSVDNVLLGMFAVLARPATIFVRRHVLAPVLKLLAILLVMLGGAGLFQIAAAYLAAEVIGLAIGGAMLWHILRQQEFFSHFHWREIRLPSRELFAFSLPLLSSDLLILVVPVIEVMLLEHFCSLDQVAAYRVVIPIALLIGLVKASFTPLFLPTAARMLARRDQEGINNLYWQTTLWLSVLSYPIFILAFVAAEPVIDTLYGLRYASSAAILMVVAIGEYFDAALGINALVLKTLGRMKYVMLINLATLTINILASLALIPAHGAMGAAIAASLTWVAHSMLNHWCLISTTHIRVIDASSIRACCLIALTTLAAWCVTQVPGLPIYSSIAVAVFAAATVLRFNRRLLRASEIFPEARRVPILRWILGF